MGQAFYNCKVCNIIFGDYGDYGYCRQCGVLCIRCANESSDKYLENKEAETDDLIKCIACEDREQEQTEIEKLQEEKKLLIKENQQIKEEMKYFCVNSCLKYSCDECNMYEIMYKEGDLDQLKT